MIAERNAAPAAESARSANPNSASAADPRPGDCGGGGAAASPPGAGRGRLSKSTRDAALIQEGRLWREHPTIVLFPLQFVETLGEGRGGRSRNVWERRGHRSSLLGGGKREGGDEEAPATFVASRSPGPPYRTRGACGSVISTVGSGLHPPTAVGCYADTWAPHLRVPHVSVTTCGPLF